MKYHTEGINPITYNKVTVEFGFREIPGVTPGYFIHIIEEGEISMKFLRLDEQLFLTLFKRWQINENFK